MSANMITAQGMCFMVEGQGFKGVPAQGDFDLICQRIESELRSVDLRVAQAMHQGAIIDSATDEPRDAGQAQALSTLANRVAADVLATWHNPDGAHVIISPWPDASGKLEVI